jgi:hypothetical protein
VIGTFFPCTADLRNQPSPISAGGAHPAPRAFIERYPRSCKVRQRTKSSPVRAGNKEFTRESSNAPPYEIPDLLANPAPSSAEPIQPGAFLLYYLKPNAHFACLAIERSPRAKFYLFFKYGN